MPSGRSTSPEVLLHAPAINPLLAQPRGEQAAQQTALFGAARQVELLEPVWYDRSEVTWSVRESKLLYIHRIKVLS